MRIEAATTETVLASQQPADDSLSVLSHLGLVHNEVYKLTRLLENINLSTEDAFQIGFIGLMEAAVRYEPVRGNFSTYAVPRIKGSILDYIRGVERPLPRNTIKLFTQVTSFEARF